VVIRRIHSALNLFERTNQTVIKQKGRSAHPNFCIDHGDFIAVATANEPETLPIDTDTSSQLSEFAPEHHPTSTQSWHSLCSPTSVSALAFINKGNLS